MIEFGLRPFRSVLYIPADKPRALEKARGLPADAIIFDLEDAVAPSAKVAARESLKEALDSSYGERFRLIRINGLDTEWGADDLALLEQLSCDAVLLPKVSEASDITDVKNKLKAINSGLPIWAMMETAASILHAEEIAAHSALQGMVMGTNDLAKELRTRPLERREEMLSALSMVLLAARAAGKIVIDGVYTAFQDQSGLQQECLQGASMGFDGKSLIHPAQIAAANEAFAPTEEALSLAHRQISAFEEAAKRGEGIAVIDGRIVENLHVEIAKHEIAKAEAIRALHRAEG